MVGKEWKMTLMTHLFVFACCLLRSTTTRICQNRTCQQLFTLLSADQTIDAGDVRLEVTSSSRQHCAVYCTTHDWCRSYAVRPIDFNRVTCTLTSNAAVATSLQTGSSLYGVIQTDSELSTDCTDPQLDNSSLYSCNDAPTFEAAAMLRMGSSRAILFTTDNKYIPCSSMTNIVEQGAEYCDSKLDVVGDENIDPDGDRFAAGPPDGAVGYIRSNMVECTYYLFKGDRVYCYEHQDNQPWMKPCSTWTWQTIEQRFGKGIPSDVDDVYGNFDENYDFYFVKDNLVYLSSGNSSRGRLVSGYPRHVHDEHSNFICDVTGVQLGLVNGDYYYTKGKNVYKEQNGVVYYKRYLCHE